MKMFQLAPDPCNVIVEIGSFCGYWAKRCSIAFPEAIIYCIDPWTGSWKPEALNDAKRKENYSGEEVYIKWLENILFDCENVKAVRLKNEKFAEIFPYEVDMCFVDGDHSPGECYKDLENWWPLMRKNGLLVVHDYYGSVRKDCLRASQRFLGPGKVDFLYDSNKRKGFRKCFWARK